MSITNQAVINQALNELGLLDVGSTANSTDSGAALLVLNQMLAEWSLVKDIDLHFPPQDTLADVCPIPTWAEKGVISNLAVECASTFGAPISNELAGKAIGGRNAIAVTLINLKLKKADMSHIATGTGRYNINTDLLN